MRVVLAGASGLIGSRLRASLREGGHQVTTLVRHPASGADEDSWDPAKGLLDPDFLADADAVVCLSGVAVGERRWNDSNKKAFVRSRVDSVGTIAQSLAEYGGPRVLVAASAVGYYGDGGESELDESAPSGDTFLAGLCRQWEAAADPAREAGVRVVHLRTGVVLTASGGALKRLRQLVLTGLAGKIGNGRQFMPWISLADELAAITFLLEHDVHGPANLVSPAPARNAEFIKALGRALHRPTVFTAPAFGLRLALGEFAGELLGGQRAVPAALTAAGFTFTHADLESALAWALADR